MKITNIIKSRKLKRQIKNMSDVEIDKTIHIQGTVFDRKRAFGIEGEKYIRKMLKKGRTYAQIASDLGVDTRTVRYQMDPEYRALRLSQSSGKHTGITYHDFNDRVQYKIDLVNKGVYVG